MSKIIPLLIILALFSIASAATISEEYLSTLWGAWKATHNKLYSSLEESHRFTIFKQNAIKIAKLNAENPHTKFAINKFADLTSSEFKNKYANGLIKPTQIPHSQEEPHSKSVNNLTIIPSYINWKALGAVTHVKDQGQCGSCWAFSAIGAIESRYFINGKALTRFSEQQLNDCSWLYRNQGCDGGLMDRAFAYVKDNGVQRETDYPYTAQDQDCKYDAEKIVTKTSGYVDVRENDEDSLMAAIAEGPVSVAIEADSQVFQFYSSGVIDSTTCGYYHNHGALAVGYKRTGSQPYYLVKNSWGTSWGDKGYVKILAQPGGKTPGVCGIAGMPSYPIFSAN